MIVVSNTSPLTNLAAVEKFELLQKLFGQIHIAEGVWAELNAFGKAWPGSKEATDAEWIERHDVSNRPLVSVLRRDLDGGESETIALAVELNAHFVLLDEKDGRLAAIRLGLRPIGVLGILLSAKSKGHLKAVRPCLDSLRHDAGFYIDKKLYEYVLIRASE